MAYIKDKGKDVQYSNPFTDSQEARLKWPSLWEISPRNLCTSTLQTRTNVISL